ncbi:MAG: Gfo/Idh/MocA family oxidoreductase [Candidatus Omnitrophica bacterium]|nr:Gfo/Idh/MocA family oxidoreductase [Candidatus Omnitrophota bacterium]
MTHSTVRVAVVGVGHVGALHAQIYATLPHVKLVAVCDLDQAKAQALATQLGCQAVASPGELKGLAEAASVATPTSSHATVGKQLLEAGLHVLMEKPLAESLEGADQLIDLARRRRVSLQVGHIERFNSAIQEAKRHLTHPRFIEVHRLSPYPFRGLDVSVILDVMIHDLDLVLDVVGTTPSRIDAVGVSVLSQSEDIANARLTFPTGCVANLTASRVSDETLRRFRVFQEDGYMSIDSKDQSVELARKVDHTIRRETLPVDRRPPLNEELAAFLHAVRTSTPPLIPGEAGRQALALALDIERAMRQTKG